MGVAVGGDDGDLQAASAISGGYPPSGAAAANTTGTFLSVGRRNAWGEYSVLTSLLRFDTSAVPDGATVTSATLRLHVAGKADGDDRNLVAEWYPAANWPIDDADYALDSSASALPGADVGNLALGAVNDLALQGLGAVSTTGSTALRLHLDGGQPAADNYVTPRTSATIAPNDRGLSAIFLRALSEM